MEDKYKLTTIITHMANRSPKEDLIKSINSIMPLGQQIIIVDDSGMNNIPDGYYDEFQSENIKVIINDHNIGTFWSRVRGFNESEGDYIHYIDSGDSLILLGSKEEFLGQLSNPKCLYHIIQDRPYYIASGYHKVDRRVKLAYLTSNACGMLGKCIIPRVTLDASYDLIRSAYNSNSNEDKYPRLTQNEDYLLICTMICNDLVDEVNDISKSTALYNYDVLGVSKPRKLSPDTLEFYNKQMMTEKMLFNNLINNKLHYQLCIDRTEWWFDHLNIKD